MISAGPMPQLSATKIRTGLTSFETLVDCLIQQYERQAAVNSNRGNGRRPNNAATRDFAKSSRRTAPTVSNGRTKSSRERAASADRLNSADRSNSADRLNSAAGRSAKASDDTVKRVGEARSTIARLSLSRQTQASFDWYES